MARTGFQPTCNCAEAIRSTIWLSQLNLHTSTASGHSGWLHREDFKKLHYLACYPDQQLIEGLKKLRKKEEKLVPLAATAVN